MSNKSSAYRNYVNGPAYFNNKLASPSKPILQTTTEQIETKSSAYGNYGKTANENNNPADYNYFYNKVLKQDNFPTQIRPQPANAAFTEKDKQLLDKVQNAAAFVGANASNILLRVKVDSQPGNIDTFAIMTSSDPNNIIVYTSNQNEVVLDDVAGSGIANTTEGPLDGGLF